MLDLNNGWNSIDSNNEEKKYKNIIFKRPIDFDYCPLYCSSCNNILSTVEDVNMMKKEKVCEECYLIYYYSNKEKWKQGWRPNKKTSDG